MNQEPCALDRLDVNTWIYIRTTNSSLFILQDAVEEQKKQIKFLNKDLEKAIQECVSTKETLAATESTLEETKSKLTQVTSDLKDTEERVKELTAKQI